MSRSLMNTREVAEYLRIKERKVYDLVAQRRIPCTRVAGKWLFPKELIDMWLIQHAEGAVAHLSRAPSPAIIGGSHDPLLDWAVRESESGLAVLFNGSLDGLERFANRTVLACGMHVLDSDSGEYNITLVERRLATEPVVAIEWARREQGLILATGNPLGITGLRDVVGKQFAIRQREAGSFLLLEHLLQQAGLTSADLTPTEPPLRSETEVALAVASGKADVGLGIAAAASPLQLGFVPLTQERYDLLLRRRDYFEPPWQNLVAFTRSGTFLERARDTAGYDIAGLGTIRYNALV